MVPQTFPSVYVTPNGYTAAVVQIITDTTGLVRWKDYIPVQFVTDESFVANSYNNNGYVLVDHQQDLTGKQAGKDFIRVFEDYSATKRWSTDNAGFIPVYKVSDFVNSSNLELESEFNVLQENGYLILLEQ
jgi:hypothetical protein